MQRSSEGPPCLWRTLRSDDQAQLQNRLQVRMELCGLRSDIWTSFKEHRYYQVAMWEMQRPAPADQTKATECLTPKETAPWRFRESGRRRGRERARGDQLGQLRYWRLFKVIEGVYGFVSHSTYISGRFACHFQRSFDDDISMVFSL